jgi:hypothetical protein
MGQLRSHIDPAMNIPLPGLSLTESTSEPVRRITLGAGLRCSHADSCSVLFSQPSLPVSFSRALEGKVHCADAASSSQVCKRTST